MTCLLFTTSVRPHRGRSSINVSSATRRLRHVGLGHLPPPLPSPSGRSHTPIQKNGQPGGTAATPRGDRHRAAGTGATGLGVSGAAAIITPDAHTAGSEGGGGGGGGGASTGRRAKDDGGRRGPAAAAGSLPGNIYELSLNGRVVLLFDAGGRRRNGRMEGRAYGPPTHLK